MTNFYILVGDKRTWKTALTKIIWGFTKKTQKLWEATEPGDKICFYVTKPTKKIIGFGEIGEKFESTDIFWPDEILFKKILWPYRLKFIPILVINNWNEGLAPPPKVILNQGRKKINQETFLKLIGEGENQWEVTLKELKKK